MKPDDVEQAGDDDMQPALAPAEREAARPAAGVTTAATAPSPSVTDAHAERRDFVSAIRIAGQVSPQARVSATSISFAVVSVICWGRMHAEPGLKTPF